MTDENTEIVPEGTENALSWGGQLTTTELKDSCVAEARKKTNIRIRQVKDLIKTSGEKLTNLVKDLSKACEEQASGFMESQLASAGTSLTGVFGVPVEHKVTPIEDSFNEDNRTFKVKVSIGFKDRTPEIIQIRGASAGFAQELYMESEIENGDKVTELYDQIKDLRETRKEYYAEVSELEDFLDCGIQILEDEFVSRVTRAKLASCKDGEKITSAISEAMADSGVQQLMPASLAAMLGGVSPALENQGNEE